tara:strand:+ start:295 stop:498 length:204 start_codon:yes stop_codon:yes gene_type:complete
MGGSTYLRGNNRDDQFDPNLEDNWDQNSQESEPDDFANCEEREEFVFDNGARYKGQWKQSVRHGYGI